MARNSLTAILSLKHPKAGISLEVASPKSARALAEWHCYFVRLAVAITRLRHLELVELGRTAVGRLRTSGQISEAERKALSRVFDAARNAADVAPLAAEVERAAKSLKKPGDMASLLIEIARDSLRCAASAATDECECSSLPPGAIAMTQRARKVTFVLSDMAGGALGGLVGNVVGAILGASAASGAQFAATS